MTKIRLLSFVIILFFTSSQSFQQNITESDKYNAFISFVNKKTVAKEIKNIKTMSLVPIALGVKDNIDIKGLPNTAGSIALQNNKPKKSAYLTKRLKSGGYYVVGKTNLSEWANFRSTHSVSGWDKTNSRSCKP